MNKMKSVLFINLIFALLILNMATVMRGVFKNPDYPGKCFIHDKIMSPGEIIPDPSSECGRIICNENSWIVVQTCGTMKPPKGYKLGDPFDAAAPYPKCCRKHFVPIEEGDKKTAFS
ncbi:uncharacterized protein ACRADG_012705 [Cochliomyia hominivorax]